MSLKPRAAGKMPRALRSPEIDPTSLCASLSHLVNWKPAREGQIWRSSAHCCRAAGRTGRSQRRIRTGRRHASAPGDDRAARGGGGAATSRPRREAGRPPTCVLTALPGEDVCSGTHRCQRQAPHWCSRNRGKHQSRSLKHRLFDSEMNSVSHAGAGKPKTHP